MSVSVSVSLAIVLVSLLPSFPIGSLSCAAGCAMAAASSCENGNGPTYCTEMGKNGTEEAEAAAARAPDDNNSD